ncbi:hypothetical protein [Bacillus thuringiensis]|uniref:hypothetical protein n=1 Tax=Bacillus thuringiensis TaxID=1428 RepID=UPI0026E3E7C8|nr:hypothetical protein [Bacillus thuringiensis]MDO6628759.1 hypothetical protein [Bacillus thuringiensis]
MNDYDRWKTSNPDDSLKVFAACEYCGNDIYYNDYCALILEESIVCEDCVMPYVKDREIVRYKYIEH